MSHCAVKLSQQLRNDLPKKVSSGTAPQDKAQKIPITQQATSFFYEELKIGRKSGALIVTVSCAVIGAFCSLSLGATDALTFAGKSLFDWFDFVTGQVFLPVAGFLTCLFIGWYVPKKLVRDEFTNWGTLKGNLFFVYLFLVRFVCPVLILLVFLNQLGLLEGIL